MFILKGAELPDSPGQQIQPQRESSPGIAKGLLSVAVGLAPLFGGILAGAALGGFFLLG